MNVIQIVPMRQEKSESARVPDLVKSLLANLATAGTDTQKEIADTFNVSPSAINQYSRGLVGGKVDERLIELVDHNADKLEDKQTKGHKLALDAMMDSLTLLRPRLAVDIDTKPATLARIAKDMSSIAKNLSGNGDSDKEKNVHIILYKPEQKTEHQYETIDV